MAKKFLVHVDLNHNELQNASLHKLTEAPSNPVEGQIYYNAIDKCEYIYDGEEWECVGTHYELPIADKSTLGGIKVGDSLSIDSQGVLNVSQENIDKWNNKSDFSGNYSDLQGAPDLSQYVTQDDLSGLVVEEKDPTVPEHVKQITKEDIARWNSSVGDDAHFVFEQKQKEKIWNIRHQLGKYPSVVVLDNEGEQVFGEIQYIDTDNMQLIFSTVLSGIAILN